MITQGYLTFTLPSSAENKVIIRLSVSFILLSTGNYISLKRISITFMLKVEALKLSRPGVINDEKVRR